MLGNFSPWSKCSYVLQWISNCVSIFFFLAPSLFPYLFTLISEENLCTYFRFETNRNTVLDQCEMSLLFCIIKSNPRLSRVFVNKIFNFSEDLSQLPYMSWFTLISSAMQSTYTSQQINALQIQSKNFCWVSFPCNL